MQSITCRRYPAVELSSVAPRRTEDKWSRCGIKSDAHALKNNAPEAFGGGSDGQWRRRAPALKCFFMGSSLQLAGMPLGAPGEGAERPSQAPILKRYRPNANRTTRRSSAHLRAIAASHPSPSGINPVS